MDYRYVLDVLYQMGSSVDIKILNLKISKIRFRKELSQDHIVSDRTGIPAQVYMISKPILFNTMHTESENVRAEKETKVCQTAKFK